MGYNNREIEIKIVIPDCSLAAANRELDWLIGAAKQRMVFGTSRDTYWTLPASVQGDFLRVRERSACSDTEDNTQITVKAGHGIDRLEIDVTCASNIKQVLALVLAAHGPPIGTLTKTYYTYWLSQWETICCYEVKGFEDIFIEAEGTTLDMVSMWEQKILDRFPRSYRAPGSLYEMFFKEDVKP